MKSTPEDRNREARVAPGSAAESLADPPPDEPGEQREAVPPPRSYLTLDPPPPEGR